MKRRGFLAGLLGLLAAPIAAKLPREPVSALVINTEEPLRNYAMGITINQMRHAPSIPPDLLDTARENLADYFAPRFDELFVEAMKGSTA